MQILLQQQVKQIVVHGNSATATKLATKRNIKLQGAVNGNADFDGSADLVINTTAPVSKIVKNLSDSGITAKLTLRKQLNVVYVNLYITVPKSKITTFFFYDAIPTGYITKERMETTIAEDERGTQYGKIFCRENGSINGVVKNESTESELVMMAQFTYMVD